MKPTLKQQMILDISTLVAFAAVSLSGLIVKVVLPSRHAMRHDGVRPLADSVWGMGRRMWSDIHEWAGIIFVLLVLLHVVLHWSVVSGFCRKHVPAGVPRLLLYLLVGLLLLGSTLPWLWVAIAMP